MKNLKKFDEFILESKKKTEKKADKCDCDKGDDCKCKKSEEKTEDKPLSNKLPKALRDAILAKRAKKSKKTNESVNVSTGFLAKDIEEYLSDAKYVPVDVRNYTLGDSDVIDIVFTGADRTTIEVFADEIDLPAYFDFEADIEVFYKKGETILRYTLGE